jgi:hypothetical protein
MMKSVRQLRRLLPILLAFAGLVVKETNGFQSQPVFRIVNLRPFTQRPSVLAVSSHNNIQNNEDNDDIRSRNDSRQHAPITKSRRKRIRKALVAIAFASVAFASSFFFGLRPANAKYGYELDKTMSLRPGMSREAIEQVERGEVSVDEALAEQKQQARDKSTTAEESLKQEKKKHTSSSSLYGDDEDQDDDELLGADITYAPASQADQTAAAQLQGMQRSQFAAKIKGRSSFQTIKVGVGLFIPTFGAMCVREYVRQGREEAYVKKGLEVLKAQRAEYFNITESTSDVELEDELKGLKKNETAIYDDEEDDDDDDDEEPEPPSRQTRKPLGPRPDAGGAGGGAGASGNGRPSEEDINRLKRLLNKS